MPVAGRGLSGVGQSAIANSALCAPAGVAISDQAIDQDIDQEIAGSKLTRSITSSPIHQIARCIRHKFLRANVLTAYTNVITVNPIAHQTIQKVGTENVVSGVSRPRTIAGCM